MKGNGSDWKAENVHYNALFFSQVQLLIYSSTNSLIIRIGGSGFIDKQEKQVWFVLIKVATSAGKRPVLCSLQLWMCPCLVLLQNKWIPFKVLTMGNDLTTTKLCLFNFLLPDLQDIVEPNANLHSVDYVLHCVERYFKLSFFFPLYFRACYRSLNVGL